MDMKFHHLNLCCTDLPAMEQFYQSVLGLKSDTAMQSGRIGLKDYPGRVSFITDGTAQLHLSEKDMLVGFRTGQIINPLERGHVAFRTDDIERVKRRLDEKGVRYSDYGTWAMNGWHQIFFYDPTGNVVEVHQDKSRS
jgi:glyoxylase I family protein